jgi:hypothetical protein
MNLPKLSKIGAAILCALSLSTHGVTVLDAAKLGKGHSGDNINTVLNLDAKTQFKRLKSLMLVRG